MGVKVVVKGASYVNNLDGTSVATLLTRDYFEAAGMTDSDQKRAIQKFAYSLYLAGVYQKMDALWVFAGDTYNKVKLNLINTSLYTLADAIPAGKLSSGLNLNGLGGLNTNFRGDAAYLQNGHLAFYNSNAETAAVGLGLHDVTASNQLDGFTLARSAAASPEKIYFTLKGNYTPVALANKERGLFLGSHLNGTSKIYSKGVELASLAKTNTGVPASNLTISTSRATAVSNMIVQLVSVGEALTAQQVIDYSAACETFVSDLSR
jgi:hypothetical protein